MTMKKVATPRALYLVFQMGTKKDKDQKANLDQQRPKGGVVTRHPFASQPPFNVWDILNILLAQRDILKIGRSRCVSNIHHGFLVPSEFGAMHCNVPMRKLLWGSLSPLHNNFSRSETLGQLS